MEENQSKNEVAQKEKQELMGDKHRQIKHYLIKLEHMKTILESENMEGKSVCVW